MRQGDQGHGHESNGREFDFFPYERVRSLRLAYDSLDRRQRRYVDGRSRPQPVWSPGDTASLLTVWSHALNPRSRERGGRTPLQRGGDRCKLSTIPNCTVCPSDSRFHSITKDLRRFREMPSFALSRRQRGFESRWGHKINWSSPFPPILR